jgi:hypothetical protein
VFILGQRKTRSEPQPDSSAPSTRPTSAKSAQQDGL